MGCQAVWAVRVFWFKRGRYYPALQSSAVANAGMGRGVSRPQLAFWSKTEASADATVGTTPTHLRTGRPWPRGKAVPQRCRARGQKGTSRSRLSGALRHAACRPVGGREGLQVKGELGPLV